MYALITIPELSRAKSMLIQPSPKQPYRPIHDRPFPARYAQYRHAVQEYFVGFFLRA